MVVGVEFGEALVELKPHCACGNVKHEFAERAVVGFPTCVLLFEVLVAEAFNGFLKGSLLADGLSVALGNLLDADACRRYHSETQ